MAGPLAVWGKLPSQGDFLRHRTTVAQAKDWQDWADRIWARRPGAQEGQRRQALAWTAAGREFPAPREVLSDLADLPVAFVMQPGALPFAPRHCVQGVVVASSDQAGRACPLIVFQLVTRAWLRRSWHGRGAVHSGGHVLDALARLAARIHAVAVDAATLVRAVDALDELYRPHWRHWLGKSLPAPSHQQLDALLRNHVGGDDADLAADLQGVTHMPWAGWPSQIARRSAPASAFWQQDFRGGYVNASDDLVDMGLGAASQVVASPGVGRVMEMIASTPVATSDGIAPEFRLLGLQHCGMALELQWAWPDGSDIQGLEGILHEGISPLFARSDDLASVTLHRGGPDGRSGWWMSNQGGTLACAVNGRLLDQGGQQRLDHGDEIEVGLTRLRVLSQPLQDTARTLAKREHRHEPGQGAVDAHGMRLLDLAGATAPTIAIDGLPGVDVARSDFDDLIALDLPDREATDSIRSSSSPVMSIAGLEALPMSDDPLHALHVRYLAKLRDPAQDGENHLWQDVVRSHRSTSMDPLKQWVEAAGDHPGVNDLLGPPQDIASLIEGLDALCVVDVLSPVPHDSVMHLFAPEALRRQGASAVSSGLPDLTRREHHSLSPDSAMPLPGARAVERREAGAADMPRETRHS
jgi:type VI secretion system protein ImpM